MVAPENQKIVVTPENQKIVVSPENKKKWLLPKKPKLLKFGELVTLIQNYSLNFIVGVRRLRLQLMTLQLITLH